MSIEEIKKQIEYVIQSMPECANKYILKDTLKPLENQTKEIEEFKRKYDKTKVFVTSKEQ